MVELLRTKLYIPGTRANLVTHPRLMERLNTGLDKELTLIAAPAGFGKTTLVVAWLKQIDLPAAWLSQDEADNDLPRFCLPGSSVPVCNGMKRLIKQTEYTNAYHN